MWWNKHLFENWDTLLVGLKVRPIFKTFFYLDLWSILNNLKQKTYLQLGEIYAQKLKCVSGVKFDEYGIRKTI